MIRLDREGRVDLSALRAPWLFLTAVGTLLILQLTAGALASYPEPPRRAAPPSHAPPEPDPAPAYTRGNSSKGQSSWRESR